MSAFFVLLFIAVVAWTVRYVLAHASVGRGGTVDDGIREVE